MRDITFRFERDVVTVPQDQATLLAERLRQMQTGPADEAADSIEAALLSAAAEEGLTGRMSVLAADATRLAILSLLMERPSQQPLTSLARALAREYPDP